MCAGSWQSQGLHRQARAKPRVLDIERPDYDGAWAVALAEKREGEVILHVRRIEDESSP